MAGAAALNTALVKRGDSTQASYASADFCHLLPCTATPDSTCQIVDHLSTLNESLFYAKLELRELSAPGGQLSLVSLADKKLFLRDCLYKSCEGVALGRRLLQTHSCIQHIYIGHTMSSMCMVNDAFKCDPWTGLPNVHFREIVINQDPDNDFTQQQEVLELIAPDLCNRLSFLLSTLIRVSTSLRTLKVSELCMTGITARTFVAALQENATLKELSIQGSVICEAGQHKFAQYLRFNTSLTTLTIAADDASKKTCFKIVAEGVLVNKAIKNLQLCNILFDHENALLAGRIFSENRVIRCFKLVCIQEALPLHPSTYYNFWCDPLSNNDTLEELSLPLSIWDTAQWVNFFWITSRKETLKQLTISVHGTASRQLPTLCEALKQSGAEEKVSLGTYFAHQNSDLIYYKSFSDVEISSFGHIAEPLSHVLLPCTHITSIGFRIRIGDASLASAIAEYVEAATSLQKLNLHLHLNDGEHDETEDNLNAFWTQIVESLSRNTSIKELGVNANITADDSDDEDVANAINQHQVQHLAQVIRLSCNIRRVHFCWTRSDKVVDAFLRRFSEDIANNYILVHVSLSAVLDREAARHCFIVRDIARRNGAFVSRAAQFARGRAPDRPCAVALERVWRHAGLLEEFAEQQSLSVAKASAIVRRGLRSIEGLHDFMRFTRVVQGYVVCNPRQDGRPQLDALNEDGWRMIRRYLRIEDVKEPVESAPFSH